MNKLISGVLATALAAAFAVPTAATAQPIYVPLKQATDARVQDAAFRQWPHGGFGHWRGGGGHFARWGGGHWHGGHRWGGYHDGWVPFGAFAAGALLGGALADDYYGPDYYYGPPVYRYYAPPAYRVYRTADAHTQWCYSRYRSYRAWDNTFQPNHGPRQQCYGPY